MTVSSPLKTQSTSPVSHALEVFSVLLNYSIQEVHRKPHAFKIGLFTIFMVVGFLTCLSNNILQSNVLFLQLAEQQVGDSDALVLPQLRFSIGQTNLTQDNSTNTTDLTTLLSNSGLLLDSQFQQICADHSNPQIFGCSPRWLFNANLSHPNPSSLSQSDQYFIPSMNAQLLVINSAREISIGIGRALDIQPLPKGKAMVSTTAVQSLGLNIDGSSQVKVGLDILSNLVSQGLLSNQLIAQIINTEVQNQVTQQVNANLDTNLTVAQIQNLNVTSVDTQGNKTTITTNEGNFTFDNDQLNNNPFDFSFNSMQSPQRMLAEQSPLRMLAETNRTDQESFVDNLPNQPLGNTTTQLNGLIQDSLRELTLSYSIATEVDQPLGKWPSLIGNVIAVEQEYFAQLVVDTLWSAWNTTIQQTQNYKDNNTLILLKLFLESNQSISIQQQSQNVSVNDLALLQNFVIKDRVAAYSGEEVLNKRLISFSNSLYSQLGTSHRSSITAPLATTFKSFSILKYFLDNLFLGAAAMLLLLAMLLIYSLMLQNVSEKTYEFGMLRALGMKMHELGIIIGMQSMFFSLPGLSMGLLYAYLANCFVCHFIFSSSNAVSSYSLQDGPLIMALLIGTLMPLISNYAPIRRALSSTLKDSLDLYHRVNDQLSVQVQKLEGMGLSLGQSGIALLLLVLGVVSYYIAPMAFLYADLQLFLLIMSVILLLMILGLVLLLNLLQNPLEQLLLWSLIHFFHVIKLYKDLPLYSIVTKNMSSHRKRNNQTTLMLCIAIAFVIYNGAGFALQQVVIADNLRYVSGADISMFTTDPMGLPEPKLRAFLKEYQSRFPDQIYDYSFVSVYHEDIMGMNGKAQLAATPGFPQYKTRILAVEQNYLNCVVDNLYLPTETDQEDTTREVNGLVDGISALFRRDSSPSNQPIDQKGIMANTGVSPRMAPQETIRLVVPEGMRIALSAQAGQQVKLTLQEQIFKGQIAHMATKVPGFVFSGYQTISFYMTVLVAMDHMATLRDTYYATLPSAQRQAISQQTEQLKDNTYGLAKRKLLIKLNTITDLQRRNLINGLRSQVQDDKMTLNDLISTIRGITDTFVLLDLMVLLVAMIALAISFFLLLTASSANIRENAWEFGVLRALGLSQQQMTRLYIYEAMVCILAAGILGSLVGICTALTLTHQFLMFNELPFRFAFPYTVFSSVMVMAMMTAFLSSYVAIKKIRARPIAMIVKGID